MNRNITLASLRYFVAVVQTGGFSKAGEREGVSQSSITEGILLLEGEKGFNVKLIHRPRSRLVPLVLTPAGAILYSHAQQIVDTMDSLCDSIKNPELLA